VNSGGEYDRVELHDQVINHLFASGLTLASILRVQQVDDRTAEQLHDVIERLDTVVRELRHAAIAHHVQVSQQETVAQTRPLPLDWRRRLCRISVDEVFAYAVAGHDFYRAGDHQLWAHESDGVLLSARSGNPLARREGSVFFDIESNVPLYYEDRRAEPGPEQTS